MLPELVALFDGVVLLDSLFNKLSIGMATAMEHADCCRTISFERMCRGTREASLQLELSSIMQREEQLGEILMRPS
jgi:hypothetical protein